MIKLLGESKNYPCPNGTCTEKLVWLYDEKEDMNYLFCSKCRLSITLDEQNNTDIQLIEYAPPVLYDEENDDS